MTCQTEVDKKEECLRVLQNELKGLSGHLNFCVFIEPIHFTFTSSLFVKSSDIVKKRKLTYDPEKEFYNYFLRSANIRITSSALNYYFVIKQDSNE